MTEIIAIINQKGGVGKTTTCVNTGAALTAKGKKVLLVDADPQNSLTTSLGFSAADRLPVTLSTVMDRIVAGDDIIPGEGIIKTYEGMDLLPSNIQLAGTEMNLFNAIARERVLAQYIDAVKSQYDYVLIDCMPSLGIIPINALAAADSVIIPVQAEYLSAKGLEQLLMTVSRVRKKINAGLEIKGILLTMVDMRTNNAKEICGLIKESYGSHIRIFNTAIPKSVRVSETPAYGVSIYGYAPESKVAAAYTAFTEELIDDEN